MFGKFFASTFVGSMYGSGEHVFSVWSYAIANASAQGRVELNPKMLADTIGSTEERMKDAISWLERPDTESRCKEQEGRRLVKEGEFQYFMPSHKTYREIRSQAMRAETNRRSQRNYRAKKKGKPLVGEPAFVAAMGNGASEDELGRLSEP